MTQNPFQNLTQEERDKLIKQLQSLNQIPTSNVLDYATTAERVLPSYSTTNPQFANYDNTTTPEGLNQWNRAYLTGQGTPNTEIQTAMIEDGYPSTVDNTTEEVTSTPTNFQFYNPYNYYDLPSSAFILGQSVADKNTLGTVAGAVKVGTGLAKNFLGGLAYNKQNQKVLEEYKENQRKAVTQSNNVQQYEEGGEMIEQPQNEEEQLLEEVGNAIQNGEDPQTVLQTLLDMGVEEETAKGMIEFVIQQLGGQSQENTETIMENGGQYFEKIKGKKIVDYKFNTGTGNYDVTYE